jgi:HAD superfamily hydrolase (TIGR01549 family)
MTAETKRQPIKWQAVFFDFDGVILESVNIKTAAFEKMLAPYDSKIKKAGIEYHLLHGGVSRYEKFRYIYEHLLQKPVDEKKIQELAETFSDLVLNKVLQAPFVDGAEKSLRRLRRNKIPAYVVSGTPHDEIRLIVRKRSLTPFFNEVHGSPRKKHDIVSTILSTQNYNPNDCLLIGDAMTDYNAAKIAGTRFLGIIKKGIRSPFPEGTPMSFHVTLKISPSR